MPRGRLIRSGRLVHWGRLVRGVSLPALLLLAVAAVGALGFLDGRSLVHRTWTEPRHTVSVTTEPVTPIVIIPAQTPQGSAPASPERTLRNLRAEVPLYQVLQLSQTRLTEGVRSEPHSGGLFSAGPPRGWWLVGTSLPGTLLALGVLALIGATVGLALRRGGYARAVPRLLRAVGFAALVGGPVAALAEYLIARHYPDLGWTPPLDWWALGAAWVLVGGAFLAVGEVVARAALLRAELDGVI